MKESILDVLLYLFEHYLSEHSDPIRDRDTLLHSLVHAGFNPAEIVKAFDWLDSLSKHPVATRGNTHCMNPMRIYSGTELAKLDVQARGFLLLLEQQGILDVNQRELVVDRAMAIDQEELDVEDLKWIVLMVLFNRPGDGDSSVWTETLVHAEDLESLH